jgi:hypothetical protein
MPQFLGHLGHTFPHTSCEGPTPTPSPLKWLTGTLCPQGSLLPSHLPSPHLPLVGAMPPTSSSPQLSLPQSLSSQHLQGMLKCVQVPAMLCWCSLVSSCLIIESTVPSYPFLRSFPRPTTQQDLVILNICSLPKMAVPKITPLEVLWDECGDVLYGLVCGSVVCE